MKRPVLLLAALCLMASSLSALAQGKPNAQEQEQEKLPVYFGVTAPDPVGQRLTASIRDALQRTDSLKVVAERKDATMRFDFVTVKVSEGGGQLGTAFSMLISLFDNGAFTGASYWDNVVGVCSGDSDSIQGCTRQATSFMFKAVLDFQKKQQLWYTQQIKAWTGVPSVGVDKEYISPLLDGVGSTPCGVLVKSFDDTVKDKTPEKQIGSTAQNQWLYGYLSAYNLQNAWRFKAKYGIFGSEEERKKTFSAWWIYDVCKVNPKVTIQEVADEYIRKMLERARTPVKQ